MLLKCPTNCEGKFKKLIISGTKTTNILASTAELTLGFSAKIAIDTNKIKFGIPPKDGSKN